jgi:nucleotide-binding universal stress UspA family protein
LRTLLVAVDGTAGGALALGTAIELARGTGDLRVVLVQACAPLPLWMFGGELGLAPAATIDPEWETEALAAAETYVAGLTRRLTDLGLHAEGRAMKGEAAAVIENVAQDEDADLIVMSTHGYTGPTRAFLGSVADRVVRSATRPVLLVRRPSGVMEDDSPHLAKTADMAQASVN